VFRETAFSYYRQTNKPNAQYLKQEYPAHFSEIQNDGGYATLNDGQAVEFEVSQGDKGPCATKVVAA